MKRILSILLVVLLIVLQIPIETMANNQTPVKGNHSSYYLPSLAIEDTVITHPKTASRISVEF